MKKLILLLSIGCGVAGAAYAQRPEWPAKPIRLIVPFGAGGAADVTARLFAEHLGQTFGQQFVVENRTGGGGLIGAQALMRSDPDGYTLGSGGMSVHVLGAALSENPGFDPVKDFTHIAYLGGAPSLIVAHPAIGVKTMKEMLAHARGLANEMPYVSSGTGTVGHIVFEYVVVKEKLNAVHVPYRAGSAAVVDLLAGRVNVGALNWATARQHVQAGTLVPIAVSSAKRLPQLPDLPTLAELGYPEIQTTTWTMISGPPGVPKNIVDAVNREVRAIAVKPELKKHSENEGEEPRLLSPAELTSLVQTEVARWTPVVRAMAKK
ncbi:MAG: tripartite tricarboxylate transporter substrate binding protein [Xanthobacteraceae bacterium]|nr:tripartite tricarboxylate transporter substrate binding protein [Xanthobacteraceae bacterium]